MSSLAALRQDIDVVPSLLHAVLCVAAKKAAKRLTLADVYCRPKSRAEGKDGLNLPARLVKLQPIPKVGLYEIAHYCRFIPAKKSTGRFEHCLSGAAATISELYIRNKNDARRINEVRSVGKSP